MDKAKIPNFLIVAIDTQLRDYLTEKGVNVYYKDIQACCIVSSRFHVASGTVGSPNSGRLSTRQCHVIEASAAIARHCIHASNLRVARC